MSTAGGADRPAFDPRHDARFQRGYQPGDAAQANPRATGAGPGPAAAPLPTRAPAGTAGTADAPGDFDALVFDADTFQDEPEPARRNPFITLLWVIGVLFIVGALTLQWQSATYSFASYSYSGNGPVPLGMLIQQVTYLVAPSMLTAGLVTVTGLLFWHAFAWRARSRTGANAAA